MFTWKLNNEKRQNFLENAKFWGFLTEIVNNVNIRKVRDPYVKENREKIGFFSFVYGIPGIWLLTICKLVAPKFKFHPRIVNKRTFKNHFMRPTDTATFGRNKRRFPLLKVCPRFVFIHK